MTDRPLPPRAIADGAYGSDRHGLICGFHFSERHAGRPLALNEALECLAAAPAADTPDDFIWLHFNLSDASAESWMQTHLPLPAEFFDALHEGSRSTRIEDAADHLVAVVNDVAFEFSFETSSRPTAACLR